MSAPIGFAGLSHLGIVYSTSAAARGFEVLAFDERPGLVEELSAGRFPISEPGLEETLMKSGQRIRYSAKAHELAHCRLIFITLDVETNAVNQSDLSPLEALIERVAAQTASGTVLVIMSQVSPGFCRALAGRLPEKVQLFYQVETLVFGDAVRRAVQPERCIVGCAAPQCSLPEEYRKYLEAFDCPVLPMQFESAELCKIAINCFLASSVTTSNTLAEICEKTGADWNEIVPALRLDGRIGRHAYLSPGLGIAGGNLERDLVTVSRLAAQNGCEAGVVTAWQRNSAYRRDWVLRMLFKLSLLEHPDQVRIGVWGLAYKQDTHSTKNSPALALIQSAPRYRWQVYDPAAEIDAVAFPSVRVCDTALDAVSGVDALIVMTPWTEFSAISMEQVAAGMNGRFVLDPYGIVRGADFRKLGLEYYRLGA